MTHVLADKNFPRNIEERVERSNRKCFPGFNELQERQRHRGIAPEDLQSISTFSRLIWSSEYDQQNSAKSSFHTTYDSFHHKKKELTSGILQYKQDLRPLSPTRRNNPHPCRYCIKLLRIPQRCIIMHFPLIITWSYTQNSKIKRYCN